MILALQQYMVDRLLEQLPERPRQFIQDAANQTVLQILKWFLDYSKDHEIKDSKGNILSNKDIAEKLIAYVKFNIPLDPAINSMLISGLAYVNGGGIYVAGVALGGLVEGRYIIGTLAASVAWIMVSPALIHEERLAHLIENNFQDQLTWWSTAKNYGRSWFLDKREFPSLKPKV
jgi:hypothetical protein